jgi:ribosomal protein S18 acetylase RimI-like enzyme
MRGRGVGSALLQMAEEEAVKAGCHHAYLDSMSFQAPGFYEKHGYTEFAVLQNYPTGYGRHFLMKVLRTKQAETS